MSTQGLRKKSLGTFGDILAELKKRWYCYVMMLGTLALLITFTYYPAFSAFYHSFTRWNGFSKEQWVGLKNYKEIFTSSIFIQAFKNMFILGAWQIFRAATFPLIAAALIYRMRSEKWAYFYRLLFVLPIVVPTVVTVLIWERLYEPNFGLFNAILQALGLKPIGWINQPDTALASLMFAGFPWIQGVGMLIYLAGLLAIPVEIVEAAIVDGANSWKRFWAIELPLIVPQVRLMVILNVISSFQNFGWQLLVTRGGPGESTTVPAWQMYKEAMLGGRFGVASAVGVLLFVLIFVLTIINQASIRSTVEYQAV